MIVAACVNGAILGVSLRIIVLRYRRDTAVLASRPPRPQHHHPARRVPLLRVMPTIIFQPDSKVRDSSPSSGHACMHALYSRPARWAGTCRAQCCAASCSAQAQRWNPGHPIDRKLDFGFGMHGPDCHQVHDMAPSRGTFQACCSPPGCNVSPAMRPESYMLDFSICLRPACAGLH